MSRTLIKHSFSYENPLTLQFTPEFQKAIPETPGVYLMKSTDDTILYIGKAKSLRTRLSCYFQMKPGRTEDRIMEMLEQVKFISWEEHPTEAQALLRENELLHAIRPPYNIADTHEDSYLYLGVKEVTSSDNAKNPGASLKLEFRLSNCREISSQGFEVFGCFKHRSKIKVGYTALLRLIYACSLSRPRFSYPAKISRASPPWIYQTEFPRAWEKLLMDFLKGRSEALLHEFLEALLSNDNIPRFMWPSLQEDIEVVRALFKLGPQATYQLKRRHGLKVKVLSARRMDRLIHEELRLGMAASGSAQ
ncbi:MAG: GIY-YIG nuclease family protein [Methylotenera sp.]|nr:GIY-YIG nuclease family protein [Oligoflexia bacterium]